MKANPALAVLERAVGTWAVTGSHPAFPGRTLRGRVTFEPIDGGAFVRMRAAMAEPEFPDGVAIFGTDGSRDTCTMLYFDERGVSRRYDVTLTGNRLVWARDEAGFAQRTTLTIDEDGARMTGAGEMSRAGGGWEGDLSLSYERIR